MIRQVDFSWYWLIEQRTHWWYNHKRISLSSFWRYALRKGVSKQLLSIVHYDYRLGPKPVLSPSLVDKDRLGLVLSGPNLVLQSLGVLIWS